MAMLPSPSPSSSPSSSSSHASLSPSEATQESLPRLRSRFSLGRRIIHGRIYDSELGVSCHWCRQKTVENHVFCCSCTIAFCGGCLKNRHGEAILVEMPEEVNWVCPKCRGGCGPGCEHCCNCGPCRKSQGLEPTGLLVHTARACGFNNVHDYLIYLKTGESQETISERKQGKGWCQTGQLSPKKRKIANNKTERQETASRRREIHISLSSDLSETLSTSTAVSCETNQPPQDAIEGSERPAFPQPKSEPEYQPEPDERNPLPASLHNNTEDREEPRALSQLPGRVTFLKPKSEPACQLPACERKKPVVSPSPQGGEDLGSRPLSEVKVEGEPFSPVTVLGLSKSHAPLPVKDYVSGQQLPRVKEEFPNHFSQPSVIDSQNGHVHSLEGQPVRRPSMLSESDSQNEDVHGLDGQPVRRPSILSESEPQNEDVHSLDGQPVQRPTILLCPKSEPGSPVARDDAVTGQSSLQRVAKHGAVHMTQPGCHPGHRYNSMASAFCRSESDVVWSKFHSEFDFPFATLSAEDERKSASSSACDELESRSNEYENSFLFQLHVKEETLECGITECAPGVTANNTWLINERERTDINEKGPMVKGSKCSSGVLCNVKVESCDDKSKLPRFGSISLYYRPVGASCTVTIKEEREDCRAEDSSPQKCGITDSRHEIMVDKQMPVKVERVERRDDNINAPHIVSSVSYSQPNVAFCTVTVKQEKKECWELNSSPRKGRNRENRPSANRDRHEVTGDAKTVEVICVDDDDDDDFRPNAYGMKKTTASRAPSHLWMADGFRKKLKARILEPFSAKELEHLLEAASCRKPVYRARETRQGVSQFILHEEGYSYLDHHPDLDFRLQSTDDPEEKLVLLRGFFFWLEHASTVGAYKPWTSLISLSQTQEDDDCVEIDGPDCEILAVVCPVDEEYKPTNLSRSE